MRAAAAREIRSLAATSRHVPTASLTSFTICLARCARRPHSMEIMHAQQVVGFEQRSGSPSSLSGLPLLSALHQHAAPAIGAGVEEHPKVRAAISPKLRPSIQPQFRIDFLARVALEPVSGVFEAEDLTAPRGARLEKGPLNSDQAALPSRPRPRWLAVARESSGTSARGPACPSSATRRGHPHSQARILQLAPEQVVVS